MPERGFIWFPVECLIKTLVFPVVSNSCLVLACGDLLLFFWAAANNLHCGLVNSFHVTSLFFVLVTYVWKHFQFRSLTPTYNKSTLGVFPLFVLLFHFVSHLLWKEQEQLSKRKCFAFGVWFLDLVCVCVVTGVRVHLNGLWGWCCKPTPPNQSTHSLPVLFVLCWIKKVNVRGGGGVTDVPDISITNGTTSPRRLRELTQTVTQQGRFCALGQGRPLCLAARTPSRHWRRLL